MRVPPAIPIHAPEAIIEPRSASNREIAGAIPVRRTICGAGIAVGRVAKWVRAPPPRFISADEAQIDERRFAKPKVVGANPTVSTTL